MYGTAEMHLCDTTEFMAILAKQTGDAGKLHSLALHVNPFNVQRPFITAVAI